MNAIVIDHPLYHALGFTDIERQTAYRALFESAFDAHKLTEIRQATNKSWVLGSDRFKAQLEALVDRRLGHCPEAAPGKSGKIRL